jgi:polygalacturonase
MREIKYKYFLLSWFLILSVNCSAQSNITNADSKKHFENLPFKMEALSLPKFPQKEYNIKDFGAVGDGQFVNTIVFEKAIDECAANGGGKIIVPAGMWLTGPIFFKSNINLHLESGAYIQFTKNYDDYPLVESNWEGVNQFRCTSPIIGKNLSNIAITGNGIIDGGGEVWRPVKKYKLTNDQWDALVKSGGVLDEKGTTWWPTAEARDAGNFLTGLKKQNKKITLEEVEKYKVFFRPVLLSFIECKDVWLDGVTFQNSPAWNVHPLLCENVILTNVNIRNPWYSQNGDGLDLESCKNSLVYNCKFDVGDDAICMKSGKDKEGRDRGRPTENVIIQDCIVYHGHGGFTVGSEMSGGIKNIKIDNCNFLGTDVGLRFKSLRGRGGVVENIFISNIFMKDIPTEALSFNMYYSGVAPMEDKSSKEKTVEKAFDVNEETPSFKNIFMENVFCDGAQDAVILQGLPELAIQGIEIKNSTFQAERGILISDADGIKIENVKISCLEPVVKIFQSKNILFDDFQPETGGNVFIRIDGEKTKNIFISGKNVKQVKEKTVFGEAVSNDVLQIK